MPFEPSSTAQEHLMLTRRYFLQAAGAGLAVSAPGPAESQFRVDPPAVSAKLEYLTRHNSFGAVERGNPPPYQLPEPKLRAIGMTRDTWKLEVVADVATGAKLENTLTREHGTALDWAAFMNLADRRAVRFLKVITCNNLNSPLGMGLWEVYRSGT